MARGRKPYSQWLLAQDSVGLISYNRPSAPQSYSSLLYAKSHTLLMLLQSITACGFLHCQSDRSGMDCAFTRSSWRKVEPHSVLSSLSASSWFFPMRAWHNHRSPRPHHCPQDPWLPGRPSPSFAHRVTSAGSQRGGWEVIFVLIGSRETKGYKRERNRERCIAHWSKL